MTTPATKETKARDNGLLIDYEFCTNCHTCEVACKKEHDLPTGQNGIKTLEYGPVKNTRGDWEWTFIPLPTELCDLCEARVAAGKLPSCVHHCQANVMYWGPIDELADKAKEKPKMVMFTL